MHSTFLSLPVFVKVFLVGAVVCFVMGYCQVEKIYYRGTKAEFCRQYGDEPILIMSAGFGLATVITFLKYSVTMPNFLVWKMLIFALTIIGVIVMFVLFWGISFTASHISMNVSEREERRHHHRITR